MSFTTLDTNLWSYFVVLSCSCSVFNFCAFLSSLENVWHFGILSKLNPERFFFSYSSRCGRSDPTLCFSFCSFQALDLSSVSGGIEAWRVCSIEYCSSDNPDAEAQHNPCRTQQCVQVCFLDHFQSIKLFQTTWGSFVMPCANCIIHSIRKLTIGWRFKGKGRSYSCEKVPRRCN